jgi:hypothetical protein
MKKTALVLLALCLGACDREMHVSGHVYDARGKPVEGAEVQCHGETHKTKADGCFRFTGVVGWPHFVVEVTKPGLKPFRDERDFALYDLAIMLQPESSPGPSTGAWRVLEYADVPNHEECSDEEEPRAARQKGAPGGS